MSAIDCQVERQPVTAPYRLIVTRRSDYGDRDRYYLHVLCGMRVVEVVTAQSAALIWDYLQNCWSHGSTARWCVFGKESR